MLKEIVSSVKKRRPILREEFFPGEDVFPEGIFPWESRYSHGKWVARKMEEESVEPGKRR